MDINNSENAYECTYMDDTDLCQVALLGQTNKQTNKQTPWPLVRERTIPTERQPLVDEI
jgi:hypothetical protein